MTSSSSSSGEDGIGARVARVLVDRLRAGESLSDIVKDLGISYMAGYKVAAGKTWKSLTGGERLIAKRKPKIRAKHRAWVARAKERGRTNAYIARKLGVTETTVARLVADADLITAYKLRAAVLTSGSESAAAKALGVSMKQAEKLLAMATASEPPRRLRRFLEE